MTPLAIARDLSSVFWLDKQLSLLREDFMARTMAGNPPVSDFLDSEEARIRREQIEKFYNREKRSFARPADVDKVSDAEDYEGRTQKTMEHAIWLTHRKLHGLPFPGQPASPDPR
jgi:hypothetical protein